MTTAFEVKRRLVTLLQTAFVADTNMTVKYAPLTRETQRAIDVVWINQVLPDTAQDWGSIGAMKRTEAYEIPLRAYVYRSGDNAAGVEQRMEAIVKTIGDALLADHHLTSGGAFPARMNCLDIQIGGFTATTEPIGENSLEGWACTWEARLGVSARINAT